MFIHKNSTFRFYNQHGYNRGLTTVTVFRLSALDCKKPAWSKKNKKKTKKKGEKKNALESQFKHLTQLRSVHKTHDWFILTRALPC